MTSMDGSLSPTKTSSTSTALPTSSAGKCGATVGQTCSGSKYGNCCGSAGYCCHKDNYCSLDANGQPTSKCVKQRKRIVISPTIIIHTGANGINFNGANPSTSASTTIPGVPNGVDTSDDVQDSDPNEDSGLEDQDYNANASGGGELDAVPHRSRSLRRPRRDKIVLVMHNRNKITRGKRKEKEKTDDDDDDDTSDDAPDDNPTKTPDGTSDTTTAAADPTGAQQNTTPAPAPAAAPTAAPTPTNTF